MTRSRFCRSLAASILLCLTTLCSFWPAAHGAALDDAQSTADPLHDLLQPSTGTLESAFSLVGTGQTPAGYPQADLDALIPPTLLKAVSWTESTWRQFTAPGSTLVSYDGGYGLMQITSGMTPGELPDAIQSAIAHNFLYNISYGAQMLVDKFLHTPNIGNDDPAVLEHWYYALWAYNGWGWVNNPNNPAFTRIGTPATNPAAFPYQERVLYWIAHPPLDASGAPLWPAIPVTLPSAAEIGSNPTTLAETATPHTDIPLPVQPLNLRGADSAMFLYDVSVPDGTVEQPGAHLQKIWLLRNRGSHAWGTGYTWAPVSGAQINTGTPVAVPLTPPLADVAVRADLVAPSAPGLYREYWQMRGPDGKFFGVKAWVDIRVTANGSKNPSSLPSTPQPNPGAGNGNSPGNAGLVTQKGVATPDTVQASTIQQQPASVSAVYGDDAIYAGDLSVPDGTVFRPGQHFVKTWRIRNIGVHPWTKGYHWHFEAGTQLSAVQSVPVANTVPGATAQISASMVAPMQTGVYTSFWQMTDNAGQIFGHQAWVSIVVRNGGSSTRSTPIPINSPTPSATEPSIPTPEATASLTPVAEQPTALPTSVPQPTTTLPGGDGKVVSSPWLGLLANRNYFPAGTTAHGMQESIALFYPGPGTAHVTMNLYRPDAAHRTLEFSLQPDERRTFSLARLAPNTDLAVEILSDRQVVSARILTGQHSIIGDPGAARTARLWWFPATTGLPSDSDQQLVFFNPHDEPATVQASFGKIQGGCCVKSLTITVPPLEQFTYHLGRAVALSGPLTLLATSVVAVERMEVGSGWLSIAETPGTVVTSRHWYLADAVSGQHGSSAVLFNASAIAVKVSIAVVPESGPASVVQRTVPAFSESVVPLTGPASTTRASVEVDADGVITAGLLTASATHQSSLYLGSTAASKSWVLMGGSAGRSSSQSVTVFNPNKIASTVTLRVLHGNTGPTLKVTIPARSRSVRVIDGLVPADSSVIAVDASAPVAVARTLTNGDGSTVSTGKPTNTPAT